MAAIECERAKPEPTGRTRGCPADHRHDLPPPSPHLNVAVRLADFRFSRTRHPSAWRFLRADLSSYNRLLRRRLPTSAGSAVVSTHQTQRTSPRRVTRRLTLIVEKYAVKLLGDRAMVLGAWIAVHLQPG